MSQQVRDKIELFLGTIIIIMLAIIGVFMNRMLDKVERTHDTVIRLEADINHLKEDNNLSSK